MPTRDETPIGEPCWIDLSTTDPDASRSFYGDLFGWTSEDAGEQFGHYINFAKDGRPVAGGMRNDGSAGMPDAWTVYLATDDTAKVAEAAESGGGQVHMPPMDVMDLGTMALIADPGGAAIGVWKPGTFNGFGMVAEPGAPAWFELMTRDYDASVAFYRDVFRWNTHTVGDTEEFRYTTCGEGDAMAAGIMDATGFLPEGVPAHWSVYFGTADTDASLARVVELGGAVVDPATDTPYGRLATASDVTGARFKLVQAPGA
jgi:uncharacterized protein